MYIESSTRFYLSNRDGFFFDMQKIIEKKASEKKICNPGWPVRGVFRRCHFVEEHPVLLE